MTLSEGNTMYLYHYFKSLYLEMLMLLGLTKERLRLVEEKKKLKKRRKRKEISPKPNQEEGIIRVNLTSIITNGKCNNSKHLHNTNRASNFNNINNYKLFSNKCK